MPDIFDPVETLETTEYDPAPASELIRTRSYARRNPDETLESWDETCDRTLYSPNMGLQILGKFTKQEMSLLDRMQRSRKAFGAARSLWVMGSKWSTNPDNYPGFFNCASQPIVDWESFGILMDLSMQGCGTGSVIEEDVINNIPDIINELNVEVVSQPGGKSIRTEDTLIWYGKDGVWIFVGDSRKGWVKAYQTVLEFSTYERFGGKVNITVDVGGVRPAGEKLKGFGGVANPIKLPELFYKIAKIINKAVGRKLNSLEVCLLLDEAAAVVVAGNLRRSASIRQGSSNDGIFTTAKDNLWQKNDSGSWSIDPERDALRMSNHTRVYHHKPNYDEVLEAVNKQFYSGEGAIQWAGEAVARCNVDLLDTPDKKTAFLKLYGVDRNLAKNYLNSLTKMPDEELKHRMDRYGTNPCFRGDMRLLTPQGYRTFESLDGQEVPIINALGKTTSSYIWCSGEKEIVELKLNTGKSIFCTPDHIWMTIDNEECEAKDLKGKNLYPYLDPRLKDLVSKSVFTVLSVEPAGTAKVYDFSEPLTHWGVVEGYIAHNCAEILSSEFMCVGEETLMITKCGLHRIKDLVCQKVEIWNGQRWSEVEPFLTGQDRQLFRVEFSDGTFLDVTENHRFFVKNQFGKTYEEVQTKDLYSHLYARQLSFSQYGIHSEPFTIEYEGGLDVDTTYAYTLGAAVGDENVENREQSRIMQNYDLTELKNIPDLDVIATWSRKSILHFVAGMADTDKSDTDANGIRIYISNRERAHRVQLLLVKCGIQSSLKLCSPKGSLTQDLYYLQITDCGDLPCQRLDVSKSCKPKYKGKWQIINSVKALPGVHNTYCFSEKEFNKGVFGNTLTGNCNLSEVHLNNVNPFDLQEQRDAFTASGLQAAALLQRGFTNPRLQHGRDLDPIIGVSATGFFVFFTKLFGSSYVRWWEAGRKPEWDEQDSEQEEYNFCCNLEMIETEVLKEDLNLSFSGETRGSIFKDLETWFLKFWSKVVHSTVWDYCDRHNLNKPNRCTTVKPSGSLSLMSGVDSNGLHPPFAPYFIRRMTFRREDPVALAAIDYGYSVIPSQSDKDEEGNLLNDPFDSRCTEWLVEIPVKNQITHLFPEVADIDFRQFSALAQMDFYMNVQNNYITHTGSVTISFTEEEIVPAAEFIYNSIKEDGGYVSMAMLARYDAPYPRLPFEVITKEQYEKIMTDVINRRKSKDFNALINKHLVGVQEVGPQDSACDGGFCELKK